MADVSYMVRRYLIGHGFSGLCAPECGCGLDDLAPCADGPFADCRAARSVTVPPDGVVRIDGELIEHELKPGDRYFYPS